MVHYGFAGNVQTKENVMDTALGREATRMEFRGRSTNYGKMGQDTGVQGRQGFPAPRQIRGHGVESGMCV